MMKTLFLITVLFVLLAFAFKNPNQSAWDFAQEVGSNVAGKVAANSDRGETANTGQSIDTKVDKKISKIREKVDKKINKMRERLLKADNDKSSTEKKKRKSTKENNTPRLPKPKPVVRTQMAEGQYSKPTDPSETTSLFKKPSSQASAELPPAPPARPVASVASKPLPDPGVSQPAPAPKSSVPIDSEELAEIGARFDRASRLLSEIK